VFVPYRETVEAMLRRDVPEEAINEIKRDWFAEHQVEPSDIEIYSAYNRAVFNEMYKKKSAKAGIRGPR
jgi:hypothetical protein